MKIFFIARGWPSDREPQWGCFERDQALALKALGHKIVVLSVDSRFRKYYRKYGITKAEHDGVMTYNFYAGFIWGKALRMISMPLHTKVMQRFVLYLYKKVVAQEGSPDIVYGHYLSYCNMALAIKRKYGIPAVGMEHWSEMGFSKIKEPICRLARDTYPYVDKQLVVSSALKDNILKNVGIDTIVVNNMVGQEFNYEQSVRENQMVRFVTTGNLLPVKGFDNLIMALANLNLPTNSWSLNIVGGGTEHDHLQGLIDNYQLGQNIHLLGRKSREEVVKILHNSDVYIMSSRSETFGVAAVEALACGLPVVATKCGGVRDFINDKNGLICPVNDVEQLSEAISQMYESYTSYNRKQISDECLSRFSSEAIGKQLDRIFKEVISLYK